MGNTGLRIAWVLTVAVVACSLRSRPGGTAGIEPPPLSVNHTAHAAEGIECADCHDPDDKGEPAPPSASLCFECHTDLAEESASVRDYFEAARHGDRYRWPKTRERRDDLIFSHTSHTAAYGVKCGHCHGKPTEQRFATKSQLETKAICVDCHQERGADQVSCAVCHTHTRRGEKPASHDTAFLATHGATAPDGWRRGHSLTWREPGGGSCALCHDVPNQCTTCHKKTEPRSHDAAGFRLAHGSGFLDAGLLPFEDSSCALCHEENSCARCHEVEKPRNHTASWERRFHGINAEVDRTRCMVCHKQQFCTRCHQTAQPISHRGNFGKGTQSHCIACHEPLQSSGCFTCHKNTLGHRLATPLPPGPPHAGATDCRTCHRALRHFDDGLSCRRCHR